MPVHPRPSHPRPFQAMLQDRAGAPALEFALLAPIMFTILAGSYDISQLLIVMRQVTTTAQQIVEIATEQSVQPDQSNALTTQQAYQAQTAVYAIIPGLKTGTDTNKYSITLSAVVFAATPSGCVPGATCNYAGNVAWSTARLKDLQIKRPCGLVAQVAPTQPATINNLPIAGMTALTSMLVADVTYTYQPLFTGFVTGPVILYRSAFLPPRTGKPTQYVQYDPANARTNPDICPGYL